MTQLPPLGVLKWNDKMTLPQDEYEKRANVMATKHGFDGVSYLEELPKPDYIDLFKTQFMQGKKK